MTTAHDRIQTVTEFGFTERQARFLMLVMRHAGVCVPRQYARFAGVAYGAKCNAFFDRLVDAASRVPLTAFTTARGCTTSIPKRCITSSAMPGAGTAGWCHRDSQSSG